MKRKISVILLSCLLAVSVGFGIFSTVRWNQAEQELTTQTALIVNENYSKLRRLMVAGGLLQQDGTVSEDSAGSLQSLFINMQPAFDSATFYIAKKEGWHFLDGYYTHDTVMGVSNTMINALSCLSFDAEGVCKPEGDLLTLVQTIDEWKTMFDSAFKTAYPTGQATDMYRFYKETFAPIMERELFQNEDSVKLLEKIEQYSELVKR